MAIAWSLSACPFTPPANAQDRIGPSGGIPGWTTLQGTVVEYSTNAPVVGVQVTLISSNGTAPVQMLYTDADGRFRANVAQAVYRVVVQGNGYQLAETTVFPEAASAPVVLTVRKTNVDTSSVEGDIVSAADLKAPSKALRALQKGVEELDKKHLQQAREQFQRAIAIYPSYSDAYYRLGLSEIELEDSGTAAASFQKAIDLAKGRHPAAQFALAALLCDQKQYTEALRSIDEGEAVDSASFQGPLFKGQALFGLRRLNEAEAQENEALRRRPEIPLAYLILANIHLVQHHFPELVQDLDHYLKLQPTGSVSDNARHTRELALQQMTKTSAKEIAATRQP